MAKGINKKDVIQSLRISRLIIYFVVLVTYVYSRYFFNIDTLCNHGYTCPFCGLRTAMYYIESARFAEAYASNKLCLLVIIFFTVAAFDSAGIISSQIRARKKGNTQL